MSGIKDHYSCKECGVIDEDVPANGGWCFKCGCHHGWTHLAEGAPEMVAHEPRIHIRDGATIYIRIRAAGFTILSDAIVMDLEVVITDRDTFILHGDVGVRLL